MVSILLLIFRPTHFVFARDLASGTIHYAWDGLTYDLSIVSAPMGTYPSFAFTQDDSAIIIWAAGKLWHIPLTFNARGERVVANSQEAKPKIIPFKAHIEKKLAETLRTGVDLIDLETKDEQRLHAFKSLETDEKGEKVVFEAAGVLYSQSLTAESKPTPIPIHLPLVFKGVVEEMGKSLNMLNLGETLEPPQRVTSMPNQIPNKHMGYYRPPMPMMGEHFLEPKNAKTNASLKSSYAVKESYS